jgi:hypothetical protein
VFQQVIIVKATYITDYKDGQSLLDTTALSSVSAQKTFGKVFVECDSRAAKRSQRIVYQQRLLCGVLFVEHSAKSSVSVIWCSGKKIRRHGDK